MDGGDEAMGRSSNQEGMSKTMDFFKDSANSLRAPKDASKLGLTEEEYEARKAAALKPYKVKREKGGFFEVKSSAKAQQEMSKGTAERIVTSKREKARQKATLFRQVRFVAVIVCGGCFGALVYQLLWPITLLHWSRHERLKRRHEEVFLPAMAKLEAERMAAAAAGKPVPIVETADQIFTRPPSSL
jgi:hypothetical protein